MSTRIRNATQIGESMSRRRALHLLGSLPGALWLAGCAGEAPSSSEVSPLATNDPTTTHSAQGYFRLSREGERVIIECNGLPNHATGKFPNRGCPHRIKGVDRRFEVAASPERAAQARALDGWLFGVAINGVMLDPTGPYLFEGQEKTGYQFEVMSETARPHLGLDMHNAHTQPSGEYHYHGLPNGLLEVLGAEGRMTLVGYAADGFPIYGPYGYENRDDTASGVRVMRSSYRLLDGRRPGKIPGGEHDGTFVEDYDFVDGWGDLDECNGRFGVTPEYPNGTYHYYVTKEFPFISRSWRGTPDATFAHGSPGPNAVPHALRGYRAPLVTAARARSTLIVP